MMSQCLHRIPLLACCYLLLDQFWSYLSGRWFHVVLSGYMSSIIYIICSVLQGSVLGPPLIIVYIADLTIIAQKYGLCMYHCMHS